MDLSIIIPIYNTDVGILNRCIQSIIELKDIKYEIILINDGSTEENSKKYNNMLNTLQKSFIKYIYQNNKGVSSARNFGIELAKGKYIMFVDSDDIIFPDQLQKKHFQLNMDIVLYNKVLIKGNNKTAIKELETSPGEISVNYSIEQFIKNNKIHTPWAKLIKNSFIKKWNINFNTNIIHGEDAIFNLDMLSHSPKIYYTDKNFYGYYYDYNNAYNRWKKFPEIMFKNMNYLYQRKQKSIYQFNLINPQELESNLCNHYIKDLFRVNMNFCKNIEKNKLISSYTKENINKIDIQKYKIHPTNKIKYKLLKTQKRKIIIIFSTIRSYYLKFLKK